ncbi:sigma factor-like helix-turn-helix DNA-binding protein [Salibacterium lacus]|uniref:Sigma factor-like helix-turn-helix DNA-binding protein n=1 Tax=Salibacterium lacus TaxID=1898109 RepID=A0ABW5SY75_9BACI
MHEKERKYDATYALDSAAGVRKLLRDHHALAARQYLGDYDATVILEDLRAAIGRARLTRRQRQAVYYVYVRDMTQERAAVRMDLSDKSAVSLLLARAESDIAAVYEAWAWQGEGYAIHYEEIEGDDAE